MDDILCIDCGSVMTTSQKCVDCGEPLCEECAIDGRCSECDEEACEEVEDESDEEVED